MVYLYYLNQWGTCPRGSAGNYVQFPITFGTIYGIQLTGYDSGNWGWCNNISTSQFYHHNDGTSYYLAYGV